MSKFKLSYENFEKMVEKSRCKICNIYAANDECKFIELQTDIYCKTFFANISEKFIMDVPQDSEVGIVDISFMIDENNAQKDYVDLVTQDLSFSILCISGESLCFYDGVHYQFFKFGAEPVEKVVDPIDELESEFAQVQKNTDIQPVKIRRINPEQSRDSTNNKKPEDPEDPVELVFTDEDGTPIDEITEKMLPHPSPKKINLDKSKIVMFDLGEDNSHPPDEDDHDREEVDYDEVKTVVNPTIDFEKFNVDIGILYVCMDVKKIWECKENIETTVLDYFDKLSKQEFLQRMEKMRHIESVLTDFKVATFEKLNAIEAEEKNHIAQIERLSTILLKCQDMARKNTHNAQDISRIETKTRGAIEELSRKMLVCRDQANKIISNCAKYIGGLTMIDID